MICQTFLLQLRTVICDLFFIAIRCTDMKKERKRNLVPAKVGIHSIVIVGGATILYSILIGLQVTIKNASHTTKVDLSKNAKECMFLIIVFFPV